MIKMTEKHDDHDEKITDKTIMPLLTTKSNFEQENKLEVLSTTENNFKENAYPTSSRQGVFHQILLTIAIYLLTTGAGMPLSYSAVILPQLYNTTGPLNMDLESGSWFASVHSVAALIGSAMIGPFMDSYGRKPALIITILPFMVGWCAIAMASSHFILIIGRIIVGLAVGIVPATAQVILGECAEPKLRGLLGASPYVAYSFGILITYSFGLFLTWKQAAYACSILPLIAVLAVTLVPESPMWLIRNNQLKKAEASMSWYRCNSSLVKLEIAELVARFEAEKNELKSKESILQTCKRGSVLKPLVIINGFNFLLIMSGTYLVVFYAVDIISELGVNIDSMTAAVLTAIVRLIFSIILCVLLFHIKRRSLMLSFGIGSGISTLIMAVFAYWRRNTEKTSLDLYVAAICILVYIATNTGLMVFPGVMISELIPAKIRGKFAGYILAFFNIILFVISKLFPFFNEHLKAHGLFFMFSVSSFGIVLLMYYMQPETKDRTLGEIEDYFNESNWLWTSKKSKLNNN